jgi:hypothetical protein
MIAAFPTRPPARPTDVRYREDGCLSKVWGEGNICAMNEILSSSFHLPFSPQDMFCANR